MGKHILCAVLIAGFLFPCGWLRAEGNNNEATKPIKSKSTENENIYVQTVIPMDKNEAIQYSDMSKKSQDLSKLKAGQQDMGGGAALLIVLLAVAMYMVGAKERKNSSGSGA